jgi:hypothetical protein
MMFYFGYLISLIVFTDWVRLLIKLDAHKPLLPANRWFSRIPLIGNLYLRFYFLQEKPIPGSADPEIKAWKKKETKYGGARVDIESPSHVNFLP